MMHYIPDNQTLFKAPLPPARKRPNGLIIFDQTSSSQVDAQHHIRTALDTIDWCCATKSPGDFPHHRVCTVSDSDYLREIRTCDLVIILNPSSRFVRYRQHQHVLAAVTLDDYTRTGSPYKGEVLSIDHFLTAKTFVFNSDTPREINSSEGNVVFSTQSLSRGIGTLIDEAKALDFAPPPPRIILAMKSANALTNISKKLQRWIAKQQEKQVLELTALSNLPCSDFHSRGFAIEQVIPLKSFKDLALSETICERDFIIFDEPSTLTQAALLSHLPVFISTMNTNLLDAREEINFSTLRELATDASSFNRKSLSTLYKANGWENIKLSIVMTNYNKDPELVFRALRSAVAVLDHHPSTEIIFFDDGSTTNSIELLPDELRENPAVRFFRHSNRGPGPTRNLGNQVATGEYITYLDSDDELIPEVIPYVLSQALFHDADALIAQRTLVDQNTNLMNTSLLWSYKGVTNSSTSARKVTHMDGMSQNKLLKRKSLLEHETVFGEGYFEDAIFGALISRFEKIATLSVPMYLWYQYGSNEQITRTITDKHISDKLRSLKDSWLILSREGRFDRIRLFLNYEVGVFLNNMNDHLRPEQVFYFAAQFAEFVRERSNYIKPASLSPAGRKIHKLALAGALHKAIEVPDKQIDARHTPRNYVFARTHFQILTALTFAEVHDKKLHICMPKGLTSFASDFAAKLRGLNRVEEVYELDLGSIYTGFYPLIQFGSDGLHTSHEFLNKGFSNQLPEINIDDKAIIFLEWWPERLFVDRNFATVEKFEDGYQSFERELTLDVHEGKFCALRLPGGIWGRLSMALQDSYSIFYNSKPIPSCCYTAIPNFDSDAHPYTRQTSVKFFDIYEQPQPIKEILSKELNKVYEVPDRLPENASVVLTQPLFLDYCTVEEHFAVVAHLVELAETEGSENIFIKPHPTDPYDYSALGYEILERTTPFEMFTYQGSCFAQAFGFGTSALANNSSFKKATQLCPLEVTDPKYVVDLIKDLVKNLSSRGLELTEIMRASNDSNRSSSKSGVSNSNGSNDSNALSLIPTKVAKKVSTAFRLALSDRTGLAEAISRNLRILADKTEPREQDNA